MRKKVSCVSHIFHGNRFLTNFGEKVFQLSRGFAYFMEILLKIGEKLLAIYEKMT